MLRSRARLYFVQLFVRHSTDRFDNMRIEFASRIADRAYADKRINLIKFNLDRVMSRKTLLAYMALYQNRNTTYWHTMIF